MKGFLIFMALCTSVALLIPFPGLLPFTLFLLLAIWKLTPTRRVTVRFEEAAPKQDGEASEAARGTVTSV